MSNRYISFFAADLLVDPFARVVFLNQSQATVKLEKTLCPTWDQTLLFDSIDIYGDMQSVARKPPKIIIELFDHDSFVIDSGFVLRKSSSHQSIKLRL